MTNPKRLTAEELQWALNICDSLKLEHHIAAIEAELAEVKRERDQAIADRDEVDAHRNRIALSWDKLAERRDAALAELAQKVEELEYWQKMFNSQVEVTVARIRERDTARDREKVLREALEWYANRQKRSIYDPEYPHTGNLWDKARKALAEGGG